MEFNNISEYIQINFKDPKKVTVHFRLYYYTFQSLLSFEKYVE